MTKSMAARNLHATYIGCSAREKFRGVLQGPEEYCNIRTSPYSPISRHHRPSLPRPGSHLTAIARCFG